MRKLFAIPVVAALAACTALQTTQTTANVQKALAVACLVDGVIVPIAQPVIASLGAGGAAVASADGLLVHPAVVAVCTTLKGVPVVAPAPVAMPVVASAVAAAPVAAAPAVAAPVAAPVTIQTIAPATAH